MRTRRQLPPLRHLGFLEALIVPAVEGLDSDGPRQAPVHEECPRSIHPTAQSPIHPTPQTTHQASTRCAPGTTTPGSGERPRRGVILALGLGPAPRDGPVTDSRPKWGSYSSWPQGSVAPPPPPPPLPTGGGKHQPRAPLGLRGRQGARRSAGGGGALPGAEPERRAPRGRGARVERSGAGRVRRGAGL